MEIFRHIEDRNLFMDRPVLTLGNFDGVHLGHQALLRRTVEDAKARGVHSAVLTFEPHPLKILAPERAPKLILTHKDKMLLLQSWGVDAVVIQAFNSAFANVTAEEFVRRYIVERLKVQKMWVGKDLRFGKGRKGRVEDLVRWGVGGGFELGVVGPVVVAGTRVSSSRIRTLIGQGSVHEAQRYLGRYHFVSGRVAGGHRRGRQLGFPTANVIPRTEVLPADGVYATLMQVGEQQRPGVTNIGVNPTFGDGPRTVESYIFDFSGDLYGRPVRLFFVKRIREERKFSSADLLVEQMKEDVDKAREILRPIEKQKWLGPGR